MIWFLSPSQAATQNNCEAKHLISKIMKRNYLKVAYLMVSAACSAGRKIAFTVGAVAAIGGAILVTACSDKDDPQESAADKGKAAAATFAACVTAASADIDVCVNGVDELQLAFNADGSPANDYTVAFVEALTEAAKSNPALATLLPSLKEKLDEVATGKPSEGGNTAADTITTNEGVVINGIKWATCNVAAPGTFAASPEAPGMFYQWNRKTAYPVTGNTVNGWDNSYNKGDTWEATNDPSPAGWRIPTYDEQCTLLDKKVSYEWTTQKGVYGGKFTDKTTGASLFLPAACYREGLVGGRLINTSTGGYYWSNSGGGTDFVNAFYLYFSSNRAYNHSFIRSSGLSVRCVAK
jgi:uncharacterized protein (TIGR02145 family)